MNTCGKLDSIRCFFYQHSHRLTYLMTDSVCHTHSWGLFTLCDMTQQNATFCGVRVEPMTMPKFELGRNFCTMHIPTKFHHPMINQSEVIVLTNKQTNKHTSGCC